jgi:hypothetical protein
VVIRSGLVPVIEKATNKAVRWYTQFEVDKEDLVELYVNDNDFAALIYLLMHKHAF